MKIAIIGTGAYSLSLALMLSKKNNKIMLWTENENNVIEFNKNHKLHNIFKDIVFPNNISISNININSNNRNNIFSIYNR